MRSRRGLGRGFETWVRGGRLAPLGRWAWRSLQMPHRLTEMTQHVRGMDAALGEIGRLLRANAGGAGALAAPLQSYPGYTEADLALFERFVRAPPPSGASGFITDFLGVRTRTSFVQGTEGLSGKVLGPPVPDDGWHSEAVEWIGLLKSVGSAKGRLAVMELGAGWGAWSVAAAAAARVIGVSAQHLCAVEADPGHFAFMVEHFRDNGLDPAAHRLIEAAVGPKAGKARWPKAADPAADYGSRPRTAEEPGKSDHTGRYVAEWMEVEILPISDLLRGQAVWDLVHIDVQGWELDLCVAAGKLLDERVRWLVVGTHDARLHGELINLMFEHDWVLENEKPPRFLWTSGAPSLSAMTTHDGTQVWRNPDLAG